MQKATTEVIDHWIGGGPRGASDRIDDVDPARDRVICRIPRGKKADVDAATEAAKKAFPVWSSFTVEERCDLLARAADLVERRLPELARMESEDSGKPITTAKTIDIPRAVLNFRFFATFARELPPETFDMPNGGHNYTHRKPVGVVGLITPWNLPLYLLTWKTAPALAMGNTIVAKPSEMTPRTASALGEILREAGLPDGAFNVVHGYGPEAGQAILEHPDIRAVSFTGGTATGRVVAQTAAPLFKKLSLELGGKNPGIVFDDCDLDKTVAGIVRAGFTNTGQVCLASSRILVQDGIHDAFLARLTEAVSALRVGDPADPATQLGALVSKAHRAKVSGFVDRARREGGAVPTGGKAPSLAGELSRGAFYEPTVLTGLAPTSPCIQEEIFGPVVTVERFLTEAEAVALGNGVRYGLAATVWTEDLTKAKHTAEALDTGMVWINDWLVRDLRVPFGGMKASGVGREGGRYSLEFFSEARNIYWKPS